MGYRKKNTEGIALSSRNTKQLDFLDRHFCKPQVQALNNQFNSFITATPVKFANETDEDLIAWWMRPSNPWKALRQEAQTFEFQLCKEAHYYTRPQPPE
jgi:hypothetical protein